MDGEKLRGGKQRWQKFSALCLTQRGDLLQLRVIILDFRPAAHLSCHVCELKVLPLNNGSVPCDVTECIFL